MSQQTDTVTLHGKLYDARSGKPVSGAAHAAPKPHAKSAQSIHHKTQKPKTLMRDIVKRADVKPKSTLKTKSAKSPKTTAAGVLPLEVNKERIVRAMTVQKSQLVSRFAAYSGRDKLVKRSAVVPVKPVPAEAISHHATPPIIMPLQPAPRNSHDLFTDAMHKATGHDAPAHAHSKRRHRIAKKLGVSSRAFTVSSSMLALVLLAGFFAYQNAPNVAFRVAAARAGVRATLPGYKPSGFAMSGPVQSAPGEITVHFRSNSDARAFTVTQRSSSWNSSALLDNFVASSRRNYQALQDHGRTVYVYDGSNATWVDGGVWYQIEGNSSLTSDQLLHIANSM